MMVMILPYSLAGDMRGDFISVTSHTDVLSTYVYHRCDSYLFSADNCEKIKYAPLLAKQIQ
jgi:hypothetical protein